MSDGSVIPEHLVRFNINFLFLRPGSNLELNMYICTFVSLVIIDIIK